MEPRVHILLATYNGAEYLADLLDSLLNQTYPNICIYALDDGSTDDTVEILESYREKGIVIVPNTKNLGYPFSFFKLAATCFGADYYCFCDQDDIWLPGKVAMAVEKLSKTDPRRMSLYFGAFEYCDEQMNVLKRSATPPEPIRFHQTFFQCYLWGFTMAFNERTRSELAANIPRVFCKDYWMQTLCSAFGEIVYDDRVCALYRRHGKNHSQDSFDFIRFQWWRFKNFWLDSKFTEYQTFLREFYRFYADRLPPEQRSALQLFQSRGHALKKACYPKRLRSTVLDEIILRTVFLMRKL